MGRVVHFEIQADDVERAKAFYAAVFDWTFQDWSPATGTAYWGIITGPEDQPGINGGLLTRPAPTAGGRVALPKMALTGMAWQGYYLDTEGNTFGIHQPDPNAA